MVISVGVYVNSIFYFPIGYGGNGCGDSVNRNQMRVVVGVSGKGHFALANGTWREIVLELL